MNPKRRNIKILNTLSVTGTNTPAKVPSLSVPPTGLGNAPGLGFEVSLRLTCRFECDLDRDRWNVLQNQPLNHSTPWSSPCTAESGGPCSNAVLSLGGGELWAKERRCSRCEASVAVLAAKLEWDLGGRGLVCPGLTSVIVRSAASLQVDGRLDQGTNCRCAGHISGRPCLEKLKSGEEDMGTAAQRDPLALCSWNPGVSYDDDRRSPTQPRAAGAPSGTFGGLAVSRPGKGSMQVTWRTPRLLQPVRFVSNDLSQTSDQGIGA